MIHAKVWGCFGGKCPIADGAHEHLCLHEPSLHPHGQTPETDQNSRDENATTMKVKTMLPRRLAPRPLKRPGKPADVFSKREMSRDATRVFETMHPKIPSRHNSASTLPDSAVGYAGVFASTSSTIGYVKRSQTKIQ